MKLATTDTHFHALENAMDATRATSETVTVPKAALRALLSDHSDMWQAHTKRGPVATKS